MTVLRIIMPDQLSMTISSLTGCDKSSDILLMCESIEQIGRVKHHKKKIAFLFSAMRHFAEQLKQQHYQLIYYQTISHFSLVDAIKYALKQHQIERIIFTKPGCYQMYKNIMAWQKQWNIPITVCHDNRFLCSIEEFKKWAVGRKQLRMEYFYRKLRQQYHILMDDKQPIGGKWNYDTYNRKSAKQNLSIPQHYQVKPDKLTRQVINTVAEQFSDHFGDLKEFHFAVTRQQALSVLKQFIEQRLINFGDYQDVMLEGEPWMYHSHISFYLNCGLLLPMECIKIAEQAYREGKAPINAVEGFIRQIIGWREYVHGIYWLMMPQYQQKNFFTAKRDLPRFYWTADTAMNCLHQCIDETKKNAYAHHIQRLMVLGNFALLIGVEPKQVNEWFLIVYADAHEWVELPNVSGMILFADGGYLASKPYAAGGSYINKMSNYCKNCVYNVDQKYGQQACPFNYLYWNFLNRNRKKLANNHRVSMMYKNYDRMDDNKKKAIEYDSQQFLKALDD